jgi:hypothetical protein
MFTRMLIGCAQGVAVDRVMNANNVWLPGKAS